MWTALSELVDGFTGREGSLGYIIIVLVVVVGYSVTSSWIGSEDRLAKKSVKEEEEPEPPRNFTLKQLRYFDGTTKEESKKQPPATPQQPGKKDESGGEEKPVYLSVNGYVFDVSGGRDFYGPGGPYEKFAGRECGLALAKMAFDEEYLDNLEGCQQLNFGERTQLDEWYEKFKYYRAYPEKGRLVPDNVLPDPNRILTMDDVAKHTGAPNQEIPPGYAAAPIYVAAGTKVYDMSFGGVTNYGPGGPYHKFAGRDVSRALAKMSLDEEDITNVDTSDLDEKQISVLADWIKTFEERKRYPVVGKLDKSGVTIGERK